MEPVVFLSALLIFVGIPAFTVLRLARLKCESSGVTVGGRHRATRDP